VDFDLVDGGLDYGIFEQGLDTLFCEVREADGSCEAFVVQLLHSSPGGLGILGEGLVDHILKWG